jgi:hypothetical protein
MFETFRQILETQARAQNPDLWGFGLDGFVYWLGQCIKLGVKYK